MSICRIITFLLALSPVLTRAAFPEPLDRGLVAVQTSPTSAFLSWRLLATDPDTTTFHVHRISTPNDSTTTRLTETPLAGTTNFTDTFPELAAPVSYHIVPVFEGKEQPATPSVSALADNFIEIPIAPIEDYRPGDASAADLDGDGQYEIILHQVDRPRDNSHPGLTGTPILDAYKFDGSHLWRIDLGPNIREGEHYTQFIVYDLDGDGRAELACKTADGTKDGQGKIIGDPEADYRIRAEGDLKDGRILSGPEFLTIFDGLTGAALKTVPYVPSRDPIDGWGGIGGNGNNDSYGNRCDRFLACAAFLDGPDQNPSLVMCRGVYGRTVLAAWDWRDGELTNRWTFDSGISHPPFADASPYSGMGGHSLGVADVDDDGKDEIVYQSMVIDHDGTGLHSTGLRHGDSMHVSDFDPANPGLEVFTVHENEGRTVRFGTPGAVMRDARSGKILWSHSPGVDVPRGLAADIDPRHPGAEAWGGPGGLRTAAGLQIGQAPRSGYFAIWWDGDLLRELLSGPRITKWNWQSAREETLFTANQDSDRRRRRFGRPTLTADLIGDWREELLLPAPDGKSLRLYTTTTPTKHRFPTLMHDRQYRLAIAYQNVVYNTPPHPSFYLASRPQPHPGSSPTGAGKTPPSNPLTTD